jgi:uncharacterized protein (TIGR00297 family)
VAFAAWRARTLDRGGAVAAFAVGALTFGSGGWPFTVVLLAFFVPSVLLSRFGRKRKKLLVDIGKGGARDAWQVLANGGAATVCAVAAGLLLHAPDRFEETRPWIAAFAGAYAAATADTWGTEIGTLARGAPRSILTGRRIAAGLSGGITVWGTLAEIAGAVWIGACTTAVLGRSAAFVPIVAGGIIGAFADSLLGATVQELRWCPVCERTCETDPHVCGTPTALVRGIRGFSNDAVNFAATCAGAATAFAAAFRN